MNDAEFSLRLVVFVSKVQLFYTQITEQNGEGGERGEGCHPSELLCGLTVIWSGAPTDSLGGGRGEAHSIYISIGWTSDEALEEAGAAEEDVLTMAEKRAKILKILRWTSHAFFTTIKTRIIYEKFNSRLKVKKTAPRKYSKNHILL